MKLRSALAGSCASALLLAGCTVAPGVAGPTVTAQPATPSVSAPGGPATTASATPTPAPDLAVDSVSNFRDLPGSGVGLAIADGGRMARGVVFRSGKLQGLSAADKRVLVAAGVTDIFDLRTDEVAKRSPDPAVGRATYHLINVFAVRSRVSPFPASVRAAERERQQLNRDFVADAKQRQRIGLLLRGMADAPGAVIIHCTEGKDRTGWVSAILQLIAGVDRETVVAEYLISNDRRAEIIDRGVAQARKARGRTGAEITRIRLVVAESYLRAGLDELESRYGDLHGYLTDGLGLDEPTIERLRTRLRTP
ncbi:MAG: tyrosine-protein phosphatase [Propionibacterium sp.]|nr:tyrosine-protein phosphatase [Propionibacterium sp.]